MKQKQITLFVAAATSSLWAAGAAASGFQLLEANASGLGNAYAGSAAVAEDASTIFFNPAGMTKLQKNEVSLGFAAVNTSYEFSNTSSSTGALTSTGDGGNAGGLGLVPNAYYSYGINKDTFIGIGISAPFGLKTEYDSPWIGGAQAVLFDIKTANLNPSIAYRINEKVSIGGGFSYMKMDAEYQRLAAVSAAGAGTTVDLKADGGAWGWNIGAIFDVSKSTALGFSYRSSVKQELDGTLNFSGTLAGLAPSTTNGNASVDIKLPDTFIMSVKQQLNPKNVSILS